MTSASAGPSGCTVATAGNERPEWFCMFYAQSDTIEFTAAAASGWAIDRLIRQNNDGTLEFERLATKPAQHGGTVPVDVATGSITVEPGWYIRVQVLQSIVATPVPLPSTGSCASGYLCYRDGIVDARS